MIGFTLFGLDEGGTTLAMGVFAIALIYFLFYGWKHSPKFVQDGVVRHFPRNFHIEHMGYPHKVVYYDEYDFTEVDASLKLYDSKARARLQTGDELEISLTMMQASSWQAIDAGLRDKRIYRVRTLTEVEQQNKWLWKAINETRVKLQTMEEELRAERGSNNQNMLKYAETAKSLREHLAPPPAFLPRMGGRNNPGMVLNLGDQAGQTKEGGQ